PHSSGMAIETLLHQGKIDDARRLLLRAFERHRSPGQLGTLAYVRHWFDEDSDFICWKDRLDESPQPKALRTLTSSIEARLCGAAIADHEFAISIDVVLHDRSAAIDVLKCETPFVFCVHAENQRLYFAY